MRTAKIVRLETITSRMAIVQVRWPYLDERGHARNSETSTYTLRLLFGVGIPLPHRERVSLWIDQHREPPHPRYRRARLHHFRAEILRTLDGGIERLDVDVVDPA